MRMTLHLIRVNEEELNAFTKNSELLENKFYNEEYLDVASSLDLDKAWDGVQYLLSQKSGIHLQAPLKAIDRVMFTFQYIDEEQDLGYGPAQYLTPKEVQETSAALSSIPIKDFTNRYNGQHMEQIGIYPGGWTDSQMKEHVVSSLQEVIEFYSVAAKNKEAVISIMS